MHGLDWFVFCVADVQTGFGPFVSVYLTTQKWTQFDIGLVLSVAGLVALFAQVPGGMLVDAARSERRVAGIAITVIALSALTYAAWPIFPAILTAATFHAAASCVLGPAIAAISLGLVGHSGIGERLGRNARFASIGNGFAAALMGACGYFFAARSVFIVTALLGIVGAVVATFLGQAMGIYAAGQSAGFIASVIGAIVVLLLYGLVTRNRRTVL